MKAIYPRPLEPDWLFDATERTLSSDLNNHIIEEVFYSDAFEQLSYDLFVEIRLPVLQRAARR